jgi:hypothetical protein
MFDPVCDAMVCETDKARPAEELLQQRRAPDISGDPRQPFALAEHRGFP